MQDPTKIQKLFLALALGSSLAACSEGTLAAENAEMPAEEAAAAASVPTKDQGPWEAGDFIAPGRAGVPNIEILEVRGNGEGEVAGLGKTATLKYKAMKADGSVVDPGQAPFTFEVGAGKAIKGWDVIVAKMRVGDSFTILLPKALAYQDRFGDMKFDMELLSVR